MIPPLFPLASEPLRRVVALLRPYLGRDQNLPPDLVRVVATELAAAGEAARLQEAVACDPDHIAMDLFVISGAFEARQDTGCSVSAGELRQLVAVLAVFTAQCEAMERESGPREWWRQVRGAA